MSAPFGDYAIAADPELLAERPGAYPTGQADLLGIRLATCSETDEGHPPGGRDGETPDGRGVPLAQGIAVGLTTRPAVGVRRAGLGHGGPVGDQVGVGLTGVAVGVGGAAPSPSTSPATCSPPTGKSPT